VLSIWLGGKEGDRWYRNSDLRSLDTVFMISERRLQKKKKEGIILDNLDNPSPSLTNNASK